MSENMNSELNQRKIVALKNSFSELGWNYQKEIGKDEIIYFLNKRSKDGQFDINLANKLFHFIEMEKESKITVKDFIKEYIQFEKELSNNISELEKKITDEKNSYNSFQEQCYKFKKEKLNSEGFSENAKFYLEITDIQIKKYLRKVKEIILVIIYNSQKEEIKFDYSENIVYFSNKIYEFKSKSKNDHFELILKGIKNNNDDNEIIEIGKKLFPLEEIISQEEYIVQITIPENENKEKEAALINSKITLHWSDYLFFEEKKEKCESKLRKLTEALLKINQYLTKMNEIYGISSNNCNSEMTQASKKHEFSFDNNFQSIDSFSENNLNKLFDKPNKSKNVCGDQRNNENQFGVGYEETISGFEVDINDIKNNNKNSYKNLKGVWLIKLLSLLCILFGLLNCLQRADYLSILVGIICFVYIFYVDNKNLAIKSKNFWRLFLLVLFALIFDSIWLYSNTEFLGPLMPNGGLYDNEIRRLSFYTTGCNGIIKSLLAILMFAQYKLNY